MKVEVKNLQPEVVEEPEVIEEPKEEMNLAVLTPTEIDMLTKATIVIEEQKKIVDEGKKKILEIMEQNGIKKFSNDFISITYVPETTQMRVSTKKLKSLYPQIAKECEEESSKSSYIRVTVKKG